MAWNEYKDWNKILPLINGFSFRLFSKKDREIFFKSLECQYFSKDDVLAFVNEERSYSFKYRLEECLGNYKDNYFGLSPRDQDDYINKRFKKRYKSLTKIRKKFDLEAHRIEYPYEILSEKKYLDYEYGVALLHIGGDKKEERIIYKYDDPVNAVRVIAYTILVKGIDDFILFFKDVLKITDPTPYINCKITPSILYKELLKLKFKSIDKQTKAAEFKVCLSKKKGKSKINWIGQQNHFRYIIRQLKSNNLIEFEGGNQWNCIAETFPFKGEDLTPEEFIGFNKTVTKDFEKAINDMITRIVPKSPT